MPLTAPFMPDVIPVAQGQTTQSQTVAQFNATYPTHKTPTASFSLHYQGHTLAFTKNVPFTYDAGLLAALTAAGAPIV